MKQRHGNGKAGYWLVGCAGLALGLSAACGSEDGARKAQGEPGAEAGQGGSEATTSGGASGDGATPGGAAGSVEQTPGGNASGGAAGAVTGSAGAGAGGASDTAGAAGAGGAAAACDAVDPVSLQGRWLTTCNGYTTITNIAPSGAISTSSTNGQYASGTLDDEGALQTAGEGGAYVAFTTDGTFTRTACDALHYAYIGQIPPVTGPTTSYTCELTRAAPCAGSLLETLAGSWDGACGSSTCVTTFTLDGAMTSTCSNGQSSEGAVSETGAFADEGGGGNFSDYSTTGVIGLQTCDTFMMPYTWQSPPQQGTKHSSQCTYTRQE